MYYNGKATGGEGSGGRTFLALRVGAGSSEVRHFCGGLSSSVWHVLIDLAELDRGQGGSSDT